MYYTYLSELLTVSRYTKNLRSNDKYKLVEPRVDSATGRRAFSYFAPILWNSLSDELRFCTSLPVFRAKLKLTFFLLRKLLTFRHLLDFDHCLSLDFPFLAIYLCSMVGEWSCV